MCGLLSAAGESGTSQYSFILLTTAWGKDSHPSLGPMLKPSSKEVASPTQASTARGVGLRSALLVASAVLPRGLGPSSGQSWARAAVSAVVQACRPRAWVQAPVSSPAIARCPCAPTTAEYPFPQIGRPTRLGAWGDAALGTAEGVAGVDVFAVGGEGQRAQQVQGPDRFCPRLVNPWAPPRPRGPPFLPFSPPAVKHSPTPRPASSLPSPRARTQPTPFGLEGR